MGVETAMSCYLYKTTHLRFGFGGEFKCLLWKSLRIARRLQRVVLWCEDRAELAFF